MLELKGEKVIKGRKLCMDTMVTEADSHYPTDTALLADGISVITRTVTKLRKVGAEIGNGFVNHTRKVKRICLGVTKLLQKRISKDNAGLVKSKRLLLEIAKSVIASGREVKTQIEGLGEKQSPIISRLAEQLNGWIAVTERIMEQAEEVFKGHVSLPHRVVSIFNTGTLPIRRGKARADTGFGRKVLIGETGHGIITTNKVLKENPADATLLNSGVRGHRRLFRKRPK